MPVKSALPLLLLSHLQLQGHFLHFAFTVVNGSEGMRDSPLYTGIQKPGKCSVFPLLGTPLAGLSLLIDMAPWSLKKRKHVQRNQPAQHDYPDIPSEFFFASASFIHLQIVQKANDFLMFLQLCGSFMQNIIQPTGDQQVLTGAVQENHESSKLRNLVPRPGPLAVWFLCNQSKMKPTDTFSL